MPLKPAIAKVINGQNLSFTEAEQAMNIIMRGEATPAQIGGYLTALRMKGETAHEIAGSAQAMRAHVIPVAVEVGSDEMLLDVVGTGGDGKHTFNVSTTTAFVVAGHGVKVAKHGNRAASSRSGSADVLMALGGNLDLTPEQVKVCVEEIGIGFLYAIRHHPAMRHAIGPRRELGQRTIFNILGPLTNPAFASHYFIGVFAPEWTEPMAQTLAELGAKAAFVIHGHGGLDELSTTGPNRVTHWDGQQISTTLVDPRVRFGMARATMADYSGGTPEENAQITRNILDGSDRGPRRDIVLLNAAAALSVSCGDWDAGLAEATESLDSGAALNTLQAWIAKTQSFSN
jgi:anthranilate phosphoribosyltransferase